MSDSDLLTVGRLELQTGCDRVSLETEHYSHFTKLCEG